MTLRPGFEEIHARALDCVHCGLCLPVCPTYRETGSELSSPRGRIYLMRAVAEERIPLAGATTEQAYQCLDCRACETACPSGVQYGRMVELTRREVEREGLRRGPARWLERRALRDLLAHPARLARLFDLLWGVQRLGLDRLARLLPERLQRAYALLPEVPSPRARRPLPELTPGREPRRGRVALLAGCVMRELYADVNAATVRVLAHNGFDVVVPRDQGCCGALHVHAGDEETAQRLARRNLQAFGAADVDAVVSNSAGCGAAMREAGLLLPGEGDPFASRVRDVSELLDAEGLRPPERRIEARLCYDDPCHLLHGQRVSEAPRNLLARIPGLKLVAHDDPGSCCGAAGIYNLTHPEMAEAVLDRKLRALRDADPDLIATGNPGCMMQLRSGARRLGLRARVLHPVQLLDEAYGSGDGR